MVLNQASGDMNRCMERGFVKTQRVERPLWFCECFVKVLDVMKPHFLLIYFLTNRDFWVNVVIIHGIRYALRQIRFA